MNRGNRSADQKRGSACPKAAENQISAAANQGSRILQNEVIPQMTSFLFLFITG
jgi:hypothetical protein